MDNRRSRIAVALALAAVILPTVFTAPATRSTCSPVCSKSESSSKIRYEEGKSYTYGFETEVLTQVVGSTDEQSKIKVKGQAVLSAQSSCDLILTIQQVAIQSPSGQAISKVDDIVGSSIRVSYQDGQIESICTSEDDPAWSVNAKRAIISMLSNGAEQGGDNEVYENDISGRCPTRYSISGDQYVKVRDLNACSHRDGGSTVGLGVPYNSPSKFNSISLVDSALTCTQELKNGVFQQVSCVETHKVPLLSSQKAGITTEIKSSLNLVSTQSGVQRATKAVANPSSIYFDHSEVDELQKQRSGSSKLQEVLNKLCQEVEGGSVSSKVPGLYSQLVKTLKSVKQSDIQQAYDKLESGSLCSKGSEKLQKILVDAAATSGADSGIAFIAQLIANDKAGCHTKALFHSHAPFSQHPDVSALEGLQALVSKDKVKVENLITASAVAHQYCKNTNAKCGSVSQYQALVDSIAKHVKSVKDDDKQIRKVVGALQALGNLDQLTPSAVAAILKVIEDNDAPERLKVRALDAFRRDACESKLKKKALEVLGDIQEATHVRIQAYLTLSHCLKDEDVGTLQNILNNLQSSQVGSFLATHIENVVETASPSRQEQKEVFKKLSIPEGLGKDARKFSRNREYSTFVPNVNLGGSLDANLIFSSDSYIPRILSTNLTLDAFGRSYNFLELGLYAEDFEHLVEKYLGPSGKLSKANLKEALQKGSHKLGSLVAGLRNRNRRDVKVDVDDNELSAIKEKVDIDERTGDQGVGDIYLRVAGTSILVESFNEGNLRDGSVSEKLRSGISRMIEGAKDHKFDLTHPVVFLDEELILPTSSGLPLNLHVEGTSILSLQMTGNLDVATLVRGESSDMRAKIIPSAATLLKSRMTVGAGPIESGLQLEGKIHSSAGVDIKVVKEQGKFEFRFNLPQERTQIIDMRTDLYWVEQQQGGGETKTVVQNKVATKSIIDNKCSATFSKFTGLKLCAELKVPGIALSAPFPLLNGPSVLSVTVEKTESSMEGYYVKAERKKTDGESYEVDLLIDTPGSRTNRKVTAAMKYLNYKSPTPEIIFKLDSPNSNLDVHYKRSLTDELKGAEIKVVSDGAAFLGKAQLKKVKSGGGNKYEPIIQYQLPGGRPVKLVEGQVISSEGQGKVEINLKSAGPFKPLRASIKGVLEAEKKSDGYELKATDLELSSDVLGKLELDGHINKVHHVLDTKLEAKYGQEKQHSLEVHAKGGRPKHGHYEITLKTRSSRCSFLNLDVHAEALKEGQTYSSELSYSRGLNKEVEISHKLKTNVESKKNFEILGETVLKHAGLKWDIYSKVDAKAAPGEPRHAELVLNINSLKSSARYDSKGQNLFDYEVKAVAEYTGKKYEFSEVSVKAGDHKQNFKSKLSVTPGFWYAADTDVVYKFEKNDIESSLTSTITSDKFSDPLVFKTEVRGNAGGYSSLLKIDAKGKNYVDIVTEYKRTKGSKASSLNVKASVINLVDAKLARTVSSSERDAQLDVKWIPSGRKIEARSNLKVEGEVFNLNTEVKWDAEKDPSKAIALTSVTNLSKLQIDSKNDITVKGKTAKINLKGNRAKEILNGEGNLEVEYVSPNGKSFNVATTLNLENKLKTKGGKVNLKITLPDEKPYEISLENRATNVDTRQATFNSLTTLKIDYKGEKDAQVSVALASELPGNLRTYSGKVDIGGSVVKEPVSAQLKVNVKQGRIQTKGALSRGSRNGDFDIKVEYDIWIPKKKLDVTYKISTPYENVKQLEGTHHHTLLYSSLRHFEYAEDGSVSVNGGSPVEWKYLSSVVNKELKFLSDLKSEGKNVYSISVNGKAEKSKLVGEVEAIYKEEKSNLNVEANYQPTNVGLHLKGSSPVSTFELKTSHKKITEGVSESDILVKKGDEISLRATTKVENTPSKRSLDLSVSSSDQPARRLYVSVEKESAQKYNVETLIRWGDGGKYVDSKGSIVRSGDGGLEANLVLEVPEAKDLSKLNLKLSKKSQGGRKSISLKIDDNKVDVLNAVAEYGTSIERSGGRKVYEGSITITTDLNIPLIKNGRNGKFRLENNVLSKELDSEDGRELRISLELGDTQQTAVKATGVLKGSDKEKRLQLSLCNEARGRCQSGDVQFTHQHESNGDVEYSLRILRQTEVGGKKSSVSGLSIRTSRSDNGRQIDHTVKLVKGESEQVGYRLYRKDGHEIGAELLLPERVIATVLDTKYDAPTDLKLELSFYIDRARKPERKISVLYNTQSQKGGSGIGRESELVLHHPDISKDLKISTKYTLGPDGQTLLEAKTVVDVFKAGSEVVLNYKAERESRGSYKSQWSAVSKGMSINIGGKSEILVSKEQLSYKHELSYENSEKQVKKATLEAILVSGRASLELKSESKIFVSLTRSLEKTDTGYEYRREILLPGMEDTRVIQGILTTVSPRNVRVKTYQANTPNIYYEAILGFKAQDNFVAGVYDNEASGLKTLADFNVNLNNGRILNVKTHYETENIKNFWIKVQDRVVRNSRNLKELSSSSSGVAIKELKFVVSNIRKSIPELKPAITSAKEQLAELNTELQAHPETKVIIDQLDILKVYVKRYARSLIELTRVARRLAITLYYSAREQLEQLNEKWQEYKEKSPINLDKVKACVENAAQAISEAIQKAVKTLEVTLTRISNSMPEIIEGLNNALNEAAEIAETLKNVAKSALEDVAKLWKSVRSSLGNILNSDLVRVLVKDGLQLLKMVLSEFIEESKGYGEALKNYIVKIVPEKDVQEIVELVADYAEKKAKNEKVDDVETVKTIYKKIENIVKKLVARVLTIETEGGSIIASIPLPTPIQSLSDIGQILDKLSFPAPPRIQYNIPSYRLGLRELINKLRHGAGMNELVPPYTGHALIIASQYYKTFDGKLFHFDGSCQYLVASDFDDGNFSVVADYDRKPSGLERAFTIKDNQDTVSIKSDNTVVINGKTHSLTDLADGKDVNHLKVKQIEKWVVVSSDKGVKIGCSTTSDVCGVKVNGFYHGKVLGLLGKFNQEKYDDLTTADGKITDNINEFVESWKLDKGCREEPVVTLPFIPPGASEQCGDAFESRSSSLRPCYGVVDPHEYQRICENLSSKPGFDVSKAVCTASVGYSSTCRQSYAPVEVPTECRDYSPCSPYTLHTLLGRRSKSPNTKDFTPSPEKITWAKELIKEFDLHQKTGKGALTLEEV